MTRVEGRGQPGEEKDDRKMRERKKTKRAGKRKNIYRV
jgi:hypothetical protein